MITYYSKKAVFAVLLKMENLGLIQKTTKIQTNL